MPRGLAGLRHAARFAPWVYHIARRAIADHQRRAARHPIAELDLASEAAPEPDEGEHTADRELARHVAPFVAMLPSPYREALTLTELEGLTQKQAADLLGVSHSGMKSRVQRGRQRLRRSLEDCCHIALDARGRVVGFEPRADGTLPAACCPGRGC
jgi:RNA polymerase sigma-70 factor (ECF subfamily)